MCGKEVTIAFLLATNELLLQDFPNKKKSFKSLIVDYLFLLIIFLPVKTIRLSIPSNVFFYIQKFVEIELWQIH